MQQQQGGFSTIAPVALLKSPAGGAISAAAIICRL